MISIYEAKQLIRDNITKGDFEQVNITDSIERVAAEDVFSNIDLPQLDNSAMDGWVFNINDLKDNSIEFDLKEFKAGDPQGTISQKKASRIYTGAIIPKDADTVVEKEIVKIRENLLIIDKDIKKERNVRKKANDIKKGDIVLRKGCQIDPYNLNLLISSGVNKIRVYKRPSVAIISTGNELKTPGEKLLPNEIYDSNSYTVKTLVQSLGIDDISIFRCDDSLQNTIETIKDASSKDIVLTIGGVSMGDYDFIRPALEKLGCEKIFWKIRMKPGRPMGFYKSKNKYIFTMPGNPVSSTVCFEVFIRDAINSIMGMKAVYKDFDKAICDFDWKTKDDRTEFVRAVLIKDGLERRVKLAGQNQQSNMLFELSKANCLVKVDKGSIKKNNIVDILELKRI